jgi:hypothetical protein
MISKHRKIYLVASWLTMFIIVDILLPFIDKGAARGGAIVLLGYAAIAPIRLDWPSKEKAVLTAIVCFTAQLSLLIFVLH